MYYGQIPKTNTTWDVPQTGFWSVLPELPLGFLEWFYMPKPLFGQRLTSILATLHMIAILKEVKCISQHIKRIIHKYILNISMTCHILFLLYYIHTWGFLWTNIKNIQIYDGLISVATPLCRGNICRERVRDRKLSIRFSSFYM